MLELKTVIRVLLASIVAFAMLAYFPASGAAKSKNSKGHVRWEIKTSILANANVTGAQIISLQTLLSLQPPPGAVGHSRKMDKMRYPEAPNAYGLTEGDIVTVGGWLWLVAAERDDSDYHIQIAETPYSQTRCLIVEVPYPNKKMVRDDRVRAAAATVRQIIAANLFGDKGLKLGAVRLVTPPHFVKVTGQFFYDDWHIGDRPRGKRGCKSPTIAEVHPIMAIEFPPP